MAGGQRHGAAPDNKQMGGNAMREILIITLTRLHAQLEAFRLVEPLIPFWYRRIFTAMRENVRTNIAINEKKLKNL